MINIIGNAIGAKTGGGAAANLAFEFTVDTTQSGTSAADQFTIPITSATPYDISTSDGHNITGATGATTLTFSAPGTYTVSITDSCEGWRFANGGDRRKLMTIENWGIFTFTTNNAFHGCSNLVANYTDTPTISTTTLQTTFSGCTNFNGYVNDWDISGVTNIATMFFACSSFNQDLGNWDVSSVTTMGYMFNDASIFTGIGLENWNAPLNTSLEFTFRRTDFQADISSWDVSNVSSFALAFSDCINFNQDLSGWTIKNTGPVNMSSMFAGGQFTGKHPFNQDISGWDTSTVTSMRNMFGYSEFNQDISVWDTANVTDMSQMFYQNNVFNQPIGSWDVSSVTNFGSTFAAATSFDQDLSAWTFSPSLAGLGYTFQNATSFNNGGQPLTWNISNFTTMDSAFYGASSFNADISSWAGNTISNWNQTFRLTALNQNINSIITSSATNLRYTFRDANSFNNAGVALNLNTSNVTNMQYMFGTAALVNQISGLDSFEVENVTVGDGFIQSPRALTTANYDALLVSWESKLQALYPGGVGYVNTPTFAFGVSTYTLGGAAEAARTSLINTYGWTITDGGGVLINYETDLVASYNFDADFSDYTGNHNATSTGTVTAGVAGGVVSNASEFDGSTGYLTVPDSDDFSMTDGVNDVPFSVSCWVNFDSTGESWFASRWGLGSLHEWIFALNSSGDLTTIIGDSNGANYIRTNYNWSVSTNTWYHIAFTYNGLKSATDIKLYVNGSLVSSTPQTVGTYNGTTNTNIDTTFGRNISASGFLDGKMDELHIWKNRELTSAEVLDIYNTENAGNSIFFDSTTDLVASYNFDADFTDYTGVNNGTASGTPLAGQSGGVVSNCLLNNSSSYVNMGNNAVLTATQYSISAWFKCNLPGGSYRGIVVKQQAFGIFLQNNELGVFSWNGNIWTGTGQLLNDNDWHHVVFTFDNGVTNGAQIYLDGSPLGSPFTFAINNQSVPLVVGAGSVATVQSFNGNIDEVHIWTNRLLSAAEVADIYNTENAGNSIL